MSLSWAGQCQHQVSGDMEPQSQGIAFQFAAGRTHSQAAAAGTFSNQMLYSCIFGVLWLESCWLASLSPQALVCKADNDYPRPSDIYLAFASQLTRQNRMTQIELKRPEAKPSRKRLQSRIFRDRLLFRLQPQPPLTKGWGWTAVLFFPGTFQEAAFITDALFPYCLN